MRRQTSRNGSGRHGNRPAGAVGLLLVLCLVALGVTPGVYGESPPPMPHQFYGTVTYEGDPVEEDTLVEAFVGGVKQAQTTVDADGRYGYSPAFTVPGTPGQDVEFVVGGVQANESSPWESGKVQELNLTVVEEPEPPVPRYELTMSAEPEVGGNATDETGESPYLEGDQVDIRAEAGEGYRFVNWTSDPAGIIDDEEAAETFLTMPGEDATVTANFEEIPINDLKVTSGAGGSVTVTIDEEETLIEAGQEATISDVAEGTEVTLVAVPADGYQFIEWGATAGELDDAEKTETTFTMPDGEATVTAMFAEIHDEVYELTVTAFPEVGGNATAVTGESPYPEGAIVDIRAEAEEAYLFVNWTSEPAGIIANEGVPETFLTMPAQDAIVTANFELRPGFPTVTTEAASAVTTYSARLNMTYTTGNRTEVEVRFALRPATDTVWYHSVWVSRTEPGTYSLSDDVRAGTEYEFRAQLRYSDTVIEGDILRFTTPGHQTSGLFPPFCFIATAAYGTPTAEEIDVLREFRDVVLLRSAAGSRFVALYYRLSPSVADVIAGSGFLRTIVRDLLVDPAVWLVRNTANVWRN